MIYLDNAATTYPKPECVYDDALRFMKEAGGNPGRGSHFLSDAAAQMIEQTRKSVARFFGVQNFRRVVFTYNCTDSINIVLKGLLKEGDHVVCTNLDHNAVSRPLESLKQSRAIGVSRVSFDPRGLVSPDAVGDALIDSTVLIALNHGSNVLGSVQSLEPFIKMAKDRGILLLLDAAQTAGRIPIELKDAPVFLAFSAHKSLFGMPGLGVLVVPEGHELQRWREGGTGSASESLNHPNLMPSRLEAGTPNTIAIASLQSGIEFIRSEGMESIHRKELSLLSMIRDSLSEDDSFEVYSVPGEQEVAVLAMNIRNIPPEEVGMILDQRYQIAVRPGLHCAAVLHHQLGTIPDGCIRISPGYFNTIEDAETLLAALRTIAEEYR